MRWVGRIAPVPDHLDLDWVDGDRRLEHVKPHGPRDVMRQCDGQQRDQIGPGNGMVDTGNYRHGHHNAACTPDPGKGRILSRRGPTFGGNEHMADVTVQIERNDRACGHTSARVPG